MQPLHQGRAIALGFVQVEAIGDQWIFEQFLDLVQRKSALQAPQHLQEARGERGWNEPSSAHQPERKACLGPSDQGRFDERGLFPRIGQEDEDLFVPKALQFLEGLEDPIPADLQFPEERVGGVDGQ